MPNSDIYCCCWMCKLFWVVCPWRHKLIFTVSHQFRLDRFYALILCNMDGVLICCVAGYLMWRKRKTKIGKSHLSHLTLSREIGILSLSITNTYFVANFQNQRIPSIWPLTIVFDLLEQIVLYWTSIQGLHLIRNINLNYFPRWFPHTS